jgi:hypothetical protein
MASLLCLETGEADCASVAHCTDPLSGCGIGVHSPGLTGRVAPPYTLCALSSFSHLTVSVQAPQRLFGILVK